MEPPAPSGYFYAASGGLEIVRVQGTARVYPWHMHLRHWTAGRVSAGAVHLALGDAARRCEARDAFLIPPGTPHRLAVAPNSRLTVLSYAGPAELTRFSSPLSAAVRRGAPFLADGELRPLLDFVFREHDAPWRAGKTPRRAKIAEIVESAVRAIAERILAEPDAEFSLKKMAERAGFSQWYFLRRFREVVGMTPHAFQTQCRIRLLRAGLRADAGLAALAASAGFSDQSHMHNLFKRHHGMTPGQFRRASVRLPL
ncbi:MAG: AraC family transcriptional regulator [Candidatus Accumulibacter sp.]|jgi:AraC-like DNA-binding protein|nr:AraC family transcriptional regulator [Accumulibacter sp.]